MKGTMIYPLKQGNMDLSRMVININEAEGKIFDGIRIDRIARTEDHFKVEYTLLSKELIEKFQAKPLITCSCGSL